MVITVILFILSTTCKLKNELKHSMKRVLTIINGFKLIRVITNYNKNRIFKEKNAQ